MDVLKCSIIILLAYMLSSCDERFLDDYSTTGVPEYFKEQLDKCKEEVTKRIAATADCSAFVYITDTHWGDNERHSAAIVRDIVEGTPIDKCLFGGDALWNSYVGKEEAVLCGQKFRDSFAFLGSNMISVYGNHDNNSNVQAEYEEILTKQEVYDYLQSAMKSPSMVYGDYYYFYKDVEKENTRYIGLDTGLFSISHDEWKFLIDALATCKEGWHIIILTHVLQQGDDVPGFVKEICVVLDKYNDRKSGKIRGLSYDFAEAKARVEFCLGGHIHRDSQKRTEGGIPLLTFDCDTRRTSGEIPFQKGTVSEQCVTAIVADYDCDSIYCYRVGRGHDIKIRIIE